MGGLRELLLVSSFFLSGDAIAQINDTTTHEIATVFGKTENIQSSTESSIVNDGISSVKNQYGNAKNDNSKEKSDVKVSSYSVSLEYLSSLYDNFTFTQYSNNGGIHGCVSARFCPWKDISFTLSENGYYTPEKNNYMSENYVTDLIGSYNINKNFSVDVGAEFLWYPKQNSENMFSTFFTVNYLPNDKFSFSMMTYKPISYFGGEISDFFLLGTASYGVSEGIKLLFRTVTSDDFKPQVAFGVNFSLGKNIKTEFTIPINTGVAPQWAFTCTYPF